MTADSAATRPGDLPALLELHRLIVIVRGPDPRAALDTVLALADAGIALVEVSLNTPGALDVLRQARRILGPGYRLGAGTILDCNAAHEAHEAGASYLVTPGVIPGITEYGLPAIVGALTPTEALQAHASGAAAIKLFPASIGGPAFLRALREPLPHLAFVPVGGVTASNAPEYLKAGAIAIGAGSTLTRDAIAGGDLSALRHRAQAFLTAIADHDQSADH